MPSQLWTAVWLLVCFNLCQGRHVVSKEDLSIDLLVPVNVSKHLQSRVERNALFEEGSGYMHPIAPVPKGLGHIMERMQVAQDTKENREDSKESLEKQPAVNLHSIETFSDEGSGGFADDGPRAAAVIAPYDEDPFTKEEGMEDVYKDLVGEGNLHQDDQNKHDNRISVLGNDGGIRIDEEEQARLNEDVRDDGSGDIDILHESLTLDNDRAEKDETLHSSEPELRSKPNQGAESRDSDEEIISEHGLVEDKEIAERENYDDKPTEADAEKTEHQVVKSKDSNESSYEERNSEAPSFIPGQDDKEEDDNLHENSTEANEKEKDQEGKSVETDVEPEIDEVENINDNIDSSEVNAKLVIPPENDTAEDDENTEETPVGGEVDESGETKTEEVENATELAKVLPEEEEEEGKGALDVKEVESSTTDDDIGTVCGGSQECSSVSPGLEANSGTCTDPEKCTKTEEESSSPSAIHPYDDRLIIPKVCDGSDECSKPETEISSATTTIPVNSDDSSESREDDGLVIPKKCFDSEECQTSGESTPIPLVEVPSLSSKESEEDDSSIFPKVCADSQECVTPSTLTSTSAGADDDDSMPKVDSTSKEVVTLDATPFYTYPTDKDAETISTLGVVEIPTTPIIEEDIKQKEAGLLGQPGGKIVEATLLSKSLGDGDGSDTKKLSAYIFIGVIGVCFVALVIFLVVRNRIRYRDRMVVYNEDSEKALMSLGKYKDDSDDNNVKNNEITPLVIKQNSQINKFEKNTHFSSPKNLNTTANEKNVEKDNVLKSTQAIIDDEVEAEKKSLEDEKKSLEEDKVMEDEKNALVGVDSSAPEKLIVRTHLDQDSIPRKPIIVTRNGNGYHPVSQDPV